MKLCSKALRGQKGDRPYLKAANAERTAWVWDALNKNATLILKILGCCYGILSDHNSETPLCGVYLNAEVYIYIYICMIIIVT